MYSIVQIQKSIILKMPHVLKSIIYGFRIRF
jgi:hypothetical protein